MEQEHTRTEIICLLDRSGSMSGLETDTVGGYNSLVQAHASLPGECLVTTVLFDDRYEKLHDHIPCAKALLKDGEYFVRGATALYDAVGKTILETRARLDTEGADPAPHVIFLIITDGYENASREFTVKVVRYLISEQEKSHGWDFLFYGANIEVDEVGTQIGLTGEALHEFNASPEGVRDMMDCLRSETVSYRGAANRNGSPGQ